MNQIIKNKEEYLKNFSNETIRKKALSRAHEIRKFEIDLYWKRATYFWAFIAASFAGYFAIQSSDSPNNLIALVLCNLGVFFSLGWYLVNRSSKYWQINWERHIDMLENDEEGPLYKTILNRDNFKLNSIVGPLPFSPTKINELLSFYVVVIWIFLLLQSISEEFNLNEPISHFNIYVIILITLFFLYHFYKLRIVTSDKFEIFFKEREFVSRKD